MNQSPDTPTHEEPRTLRADEQQLNRIFFPSVLFWTILIAGLAGFTYRGAYTATLESAKVSARAAFMKDVAYRQWAALHGGVYVPVTPETPPNPYLADLKERDISTPSGKRLTLMNPAYMTRQVHEVGQKLYGLHGHITSLRPIRPENAADPWERGALLDFQRGQGEAISLETMGQETYLRLMRPLMTEAACLKCHAKQGCKLGDIRGGISVSVPWEHSRRGLLTQLRATIAAFGAIWAVGVLGMGVGWRQIRRHLSMRRRAEERLRLAESERERDRGNALVAQLIQGLAHEIRNPLFAINVNAAVLEKKAATVQNAAAAIGFLKEHAGRLNSLMQELLELVRPPLAEEIVECLLRDVIQSAVLAVERQDPEAAGRIIVEVPEVPFALRAVPDRLQRVFSHLLENALQNSPGESRVTVRVGRSAAQALVEVMDEGSGIPKRIRERLFEPFVTTHTGRRGLGLALAKHHVESMGGTLEGINNEPPPGATFTVRLPLGKE